MIQAARWATFEDSHHRMDHWLTPATRKQEVRQDAQRDRCAIQKACRETLRLHLSILN